MALTKVTGQVINNTTGLVVGVTTVGGGLSATDGFFSGIVTAVGDASFSGNVSVGGTLTYEDVTNIDAVGLITARNGVVVGSGITLSKDGDVFFTGIATGNGSGLTNLPAANLTGALPALDGSALTGVANTAVIFADKISLGDNEHINIGLGSDLKLSHDSNNSIISNSTGELLIDSEIINLRDTSNTSRLRVEPAGTVKVSKNLSVTGIATVGSAVTISESGIEASGIGVTIASLNGGQTSMNRNMVKNGAMVIAQRGTSAITWGQGNGYAIDTMRGRNNGGEFSMQQVVDAPAGTGLYYSLKCQVTSADTSVGASEYNTVVHIIEGYDFQRTAFGTSGAKDLTLSFYVKCNATGVFTGSLVNSGNNRSFAFTYSITQALTWSRVVIKVPGDTSGTWNKDNGVGIKIVLALKIGSNFVTANPNTWAGSELMGTTSGYNLMVSTSNYIYFTGIQLEEGTEATPFEHVHYSEALRQCQRYFWKNADNTYRRVNGYKRHDSNVHFELQAPVPMRVAPSPNLTDGGIFTNFQGNIGGSQSSPSISEWDVSIGKGLIVISSDYSSTHVNIPSWEGYQLELSAEF